MEYKAITEAARLLADGSGMDWKFTEHWRLKLSLNQIVFSEAAVT